MRTVLHLALKDLRLLVRDRLGAFFTFLFPILYALLFGLMFSGVGDTSEPVRIAVVDRDQTQGSRDFVELLSTSGAFKVTITDEDAAAADLVRQGRVAAAITIPEGFGDPSEFLLSGRPVELDGIVDPSKAPETAIVRGALQGLVFRHIASQLQDPARASEIIAKAREQIGQQADQATAIAMSTLLSGLEGVLAATPRVEGASDHPGVFDGGFVAMDFREITTGDRRVPASAFAVTFAQGAAWGLMACALGSSLSLVSERGNGTLVRLTLAPVSRWQILAGKALGCFCTSMLMLAVLALFVHLPMFGVHVASYPLLLLAMSCGCIAFVGVTMVIAVSGRSVAAVEGFGRAVLLVLALAGGAAVPLLFMPSWMRSIAGLSPFRWAIEAIDGAVWRNYGIAEMIVPCLVLIGIGVAGFVIGAICFRSSRFVAA